MEGPGLKTSSSLIECPLTQPSTTSDFKASEAAQILSTIGPGVDGNSGAPALSLTPCLLTL